jgi:hypothetical protein
MAEEEVIGMLFVALFSAAVLLLCVVFVWPSIGDVTETITHADSPLVSEPGSPEGRLVTQLAAGQLTRAQYLLAMEDLAARENDRHPLAVPPDGGVTS